MPSRSGPEPAGSLFEDTVAGLHDFLVSTALPSLIARGARAVDLGAGTGALAERLKGLGLEVTAVDRTAHRFGADVPFVALDLDHPDFSSRLGRETFDLVTAVEVIEHLESPVSFLRNVRRLLKPRGAAVVTTPNVDNAPARVKFLLTGRLRMMDEPTHISPIFWDLLSRQYLGLAGLRLLSHRVFPPAGYLVTRPRYAWAFRLLATCLGGPALQGDIHVLTVGPAD